MSYSLSDIYNALLGAGVPPNDALKPTAISGAESGFGASNVSGVNSNGTIDYGVFQINSGAWPQFGGSSVATQWEAAQIYNQQSLGAWSTYNSGAYQNYIQV